MHNTDIEKSNQRINGIDESKYICCCGCHVISCVTFWSILSIVMSATTVLSSLSSLFYLLYIPSSVTSQHFQNQSIGNVTWLEPETIISVSNGSNIANGVIDIILNGGVLYGIYKTKSVALLPYIVVKSFFLILVGSVIFIALIITAVVVIARGENALLFFVLIIIGLIGLIVFFIAFLFIYMYWRSYKYLKEVERIRDSTIYPMQQTSTVPT